MWGDASAEWDPWAWAREMQPPVRVRETPDLPGKVLGAVDHRRRIIWLAQHLTDAERRSTLALELGHLQYGPTPTDPCLARAYQRAAEEWAALMLVSSAQFVRAWATCVDLAEMAEQCRVDLSTFRARIRAASDADQDEAVEAIKQARTSA